jgi:hypothetical protein
MPSAQSWIIHASTIVIPARALLDLLAVVEVFVDQGTLILEPQPEGIVIILLEDIANL